MSPLMRTARPFVAGLLASSALLAVIAVRRWYRTWGATPAEARETLPGDLEVERPDIVETHAIGIDATPEDVWPWIVQLGTGRAGWYSYDWIENAMGLTVRSADRIVPELQELKEGDTIPLGGDVALPVKWIEPRHLLLLAGHQPTIGDASWLFLLRLRPDGGTRLIVRFRVHSSATGPQRALVALVEPGSFVMERKMLLGIKGRAERLAHERAPATVEAHT